jgi:signal transduction histidine kinase
MRSADNTVLEGSGASLRVRVDALLQKTIRETRSIAWDLCPPRSHDNSLLGSLEIIWADARARAPDLRLSTQSTVQDAGIPAALKHELVQIAPMAIEWARQETSVRQLVWDLSRVDNRIRLAIGVQGDPSQNSAAGLARRAPCGPAEAIRARVSLSRGETTGVEDLHGGRMLVAYWSENLPHSDRR